MKHFIKDMKLALIESNMSGLDLGILSQALANCEELEAEGFGDLGTQALAKYYEITEMPEESRNLQILEIEEGNSMLEIQELSKSYGKTQAVDKVSFFVPGTDRWESCLDQTARENLRSSRVLQGFCAYKGRIGIQGISSKEVQAKKIFAYVPEIPAMFDALTVREHIEYVRKAYESPITDEEVETLLKRFELDDKQEKMGNELSKGMMQKVSICCALAIKPKVMLLDEPMVGLDPRAIKELKEVVLELRSSGVTVLISTHMLEMVEDLWDIMFVMEKGKIIGSYNKSEVGEKDLDALFFEMTGGEEV